MGGTSESFMTHDKTGTKNTSFSVDNMSVNGVKVDPSGEFSYEVDPKKVKGKPGKVKLISINWIKF